MKTCNKRLLKRLLHWSPSEMTTSATSWREERKQFKFQLVYWTLIKLCEFFSLIGGSDYKLIYRHYATLYFVFCVDSSESELGILDLIQVSFFTVIVFQFVLFTVFSPSINFYFIYGIKWMHISTFRCLWKL